jgi:hypothetical protein
MKYSNLAAFQRHLKESSPNHFSKIYAVVIGDTYERRFYAGKMVKLFRHFKPQMKEEWCSLAGGLEGSLFDEERILLISLPEKGKKDSLQALAKTLKSVSEKDKVVVIGESLPLEFYEILKGEMVVLDLSGEKPWEKEKRYKEELIKEAKMQGKRLDVQSVNLLVDRTGVDFAVLLSELNKLITFVGNGLEILPQHVEAMTPITREQNFWNIAEGLVFEQGGKTAKVDFYDLSEFLAFLGQVRFYLYGGLEIYQQISLKQQLKFRNMRPQQIEKYEFLCKEKGDAYFVGKLKAVFEIEVLAKSYGTNLSVLWEMLLIKFSHDASFTPQFAS